jgi:hypothetical protein
MEEVIDRWNLQDYTIIRVSGSDPVKNSRVIAQHMDKRDVQAATR